MDNANAFVAQESDDSFSYSVRVAGFDLLGVSLRRVTSTSVSFSDPHVLIFADIARAQHDRHDQRLPGYHPTCHRPISAAARFRQPRLVPRPMCISSYAQELTGKSRRWRSLEAALAAVGSQGEEMLDAIDDEIDSGRGKPIDIESLLTNVIPNYLVLSRKLNLVLVPGLLSSMHLAPWCRAPIPPGPRIRVREPIRKAFAWTARCAVPRGSHPGPRGVRGGRSCQGLRGESHSQVRSRCPPWFKRFS